MQIPRRCIWIAMLAALAMTSFGRLGDTKSELEKRFGLAMLEHDAEISTQGKRVKIGRTALFRQDDWVLTATIVSSKCVALTYGKVGDFTSEQMQKLLTSNSQGCDWVEDIHQSNATKRVWLRLDGAAAKYEKSSRTMHFTAPDYHAQVKLVEERERKKAEKVPEF